MVHEYYKYMRLGIVHFMIFPETMKGEGPILETMSKILNDPFFQAIEITWIKDDEVRERAKDLLWESGKVVAYGAAPPLLVNKLSLCATDDTIRQKAVEQIKACIDEAVVLGAGGVAVLSTTFEGEDKKEKQTALLIESLKELCDYAKERGKNLVLESFDRVPFGKNCLIGPTQEAVKVSEAVRADYDNFGLLIDLSHLPLLGETSRQALGIAREHLVHVHVGNCVMRDPSHPAYGDNHPPFGIPEGENDVEDLAEFLEALFEIGYLKEGGDNIVSFEVMPLPGQTSEEVIESTKHVFYEAWERLW